MERWHMYYEIHSMKNQGFSKRQIAEKRQLDFRTVSKYLAMTPEEFEANALKKERMRSLALYEGVVADWLRRYPDMSAAQVYDWLKEHYQVTVAERTARRFVEELREKYAIPKTKETTRQYEAVDDPPMGRQMQVDIGEAWIRDTYKGRHIKLYCVAAVMSHSRYKWGIWYTRKPTARQFVQALQICFEELRGMPKELVFDQDRLVAVDENYGEIIYTQQFEQFRLTSGFDVYLCRKSDPQTKGRTEAVVKYFKGNFAKNRQFKDIDIWNETFNEWLERTGNAKQHGITKKVPAEVFEQERLFLKPLPSTIKDSEDIVTRIVHKDNTIFYDGNRYTVPLGTYTPGRVVTLEVKEDKLLICDTIDHYVITDHTISKTKGELVKNNNHMRDTSTKLDAVEETLRKKLNSTEEAGVFLSQIRRLKPRYARDQFMLVDKTLDKHGQAVVWKALNYCLTHSLFSAVEFRNAAEYFESRLEVAAGEALLAGNIIAFDFAAAVSKKRELSQYARAAKGGGQV
jgi:transposase